MIKRKPVAFDALAAHLLRRAVVLPPQAKTVDDVVDLTGDDDDDAGPPPVPVATSKQAALLGKRALECSTHFRRPPPPPPQPTVLSQRTQTSQAPFTSSAPSAPSATTVPRDPFGEAVALYCKATRKIATRGLTTGLLGDRHAPTTPADILQSEARKKQFTEWACGRLEGRGSLAAFVCGPVGCGKSTAVRVMLEHAGFEVRVLAPNAACKREVPDVAVRRFVTAEVRKGQPCALVLEDIECQTDIHDVRISAESGGNGSVWFETLARFLWASSEQGALGQGNAGRRKKAVRYPGIAVVFTCTETADKRVRSIRDSCIRFVWGAPFDSAMVSRIRYIALAERSPITEERAAEIVRRSRGDMRAAVGALAFDLTPVNVAKNVAGCKDVTFNVFETIDAVLFHRNGMQPLSLSVKSLARIVAEDATFTTLALAENYTQVHLGRTTQAVVDEMARMADCFSVFDATDRWNVINPANDLAPAIASHLYGRGVDFCSRDAKQRAQFPMGIKTPVFARAMASRAVETHHALVGSYGGSALDCIETLYLIRDLSHTSAFIQHVGEADIKRGAVIHLLEGEYMFGDKAGHGAEELIADFDRRALKAGIWEATSSSSPKKRK